MATLNIYYDTRVIRKDGTYAIKFRVNHYTEFYILSGMYAAKTEFDGHKFIGNNSKYKNIILREKYNTVERLLLHLEEEHMLQDINARQLKVRILSALDPSKTVTVFIDVMDEFTSSITNANTRASYLQTRAKVEQFDRKVCFATMNTQWLQDFDNYMRDAGMAVNTRSIHMRNIRAVVNYAIKKDYTALYPFRNFQIKNEETRHRCLEVEQLQQLMTCEHDKKQEEYLDVFFLMFYLIGINAADLFSPDTKWEKGRCEYRRAKTGKLYSIKIEPEADAILQKYDYNIRKVLAGKDHHTYCYGMSRSMKKLSSTPITRHGLGGKKQRTPICEEISPYWARHTWATIAAELDIPKETISQALGHSVKTVTDVYIKFDRRKIDTANRKVLDYLQQICSPCSQSYIQEYQYSSTSYAISYSCDLQSSHISL